MKNEIFWMVALGSFITGILLGMVFTDAAYKDGLLELPDRTFNVVPEPTCHDSVVFTDLRKLDNNKFTCTSPEAELEVIYLKYVAITTCTCPRAEKLESDTGVN